MWFTVAQDLGRQFSAGGVFGFQFPTEAALQIQVPESPGAAPSSEPQANAKPPEPSPEVKLAQVQAKSAKGFWFYQYLTVAYLLFVGFWLWYSPHRLDLP